MNPVRQSKKLRGMMVSVMILASLVFWFVTASAGMAVQRIVSGGNGGLVARFICTATDLYEAPMILLGRIPQLKRANETLADRWCQILSAPETTP